MYFIFLLPNLYRSTSTRKIVIHINRYQMQIFVGGLEAFCQLVREKLVDV